MLSTLKRFQMIFFYFSKYMYSSFQNNTRILQNKKVA